MFKVAIIAVNEDCEGIERWLVNYIGEKMVTHREFEPMLFSNQDELSTEEIADRCAEEADRTIIVFDAIRGMNSRFANTVYALYDREIKPILLISNSDSLHANLYVAENALDELWMLAQPEFDDDDEPIFHNLYFSYEKEGIDTIPKVRTTDNIDALINLIS